MHLHVANASLALCDNPFGWRLHDGLTAAVSTLDLERELTWTCDRGHLRELRNDLDGKRSDAVRDAHLERYTNALRELWSTCNSIFGSREHRRLKCTRHITA